MIIIIIIITLFVAHALRIFTRVEAVPFVWIIWSAYIIDNDNHDGWQRVVGTREVN